MCMGEETDKWVSEGSGEGRKTDRLVGEGGAEENGERWVSEWGIG
jgi:hypothetical protein